jgi:hypothetical protein
MPTNGWENETRRGRRRSRRFFLAIVSGFAGLYVGVEVFPSGKTPLDSLYTSFFIMGFTDYSPAPGYGQLVVIAQLVGGVLLPAALFPIHVSRISTYSEAGTR